MSPDPMAALALAAAQHLRKEADFNRAWTDGRRDMTGATPAYIRRRIDLAEERERWAGAIEALAARPAGGA